MISRADLQALRASLDEWRGPGLPVSLSRECTRLLGVSDVSFSYFGASDQFTLSASSADSGRLGEWAFTFQEGPSFDAAATSTSKGAETAHADLNPWPRLSAKAQAIGYDWIASIPLQVGGSTFATIDLQNRNGAVPPESVTDAEKIAGEIACPMIASLRRQSSSLADPAQNDKFHQATGMVMSQMGVAVKTAVETLRTHAWTHDRLLREVADDVVAQTLSFAHTAQT